KSWRHQVRQRDSVLVLTPKSSRSRAARQGVVPWWSAVASTTTAPRYTLRPRKRTDAGGHPLATVGAGTTKAQAPVTLAVDGARDLPITEVARPHVTEREFAAAWQRQPKWIASRTLASVGPNATLIRGDLDAFVRDLKATVHGELDVAGPELAAAVAPLIDEYRLYSEGTPTDA